MRTQLASFQRALPRLMLCGAAVLSLAACGTIPAPEPGGRWRALDRFSDVPTAILLKGHYVYYVAPVDGTLKGVLERWAADSGVALKYLSTHDFTLHSRAAEVRAEDLGTAVRLLSDAYAGYGLAVRFESGAIVVDVPFQAPSAEDAA